jgi:hypothetical protein
MTCFDDLDEHEQRSLLHLIVCNCYGDAVSDMPLLSPTVRSHVETLEMMANGFELDSLCLPPKDRTEIEAFLDGLARVVVNKR